MTDSRTREIVERLRDLTRDSLTDRCEAADEIERLAAEVEKLAEHPENSPCKQAIDELWRDVILAHRPDYGDWEYPGQAYRHLLAEFDALRADRDRLAVELEAGKDRCAVVEKINAQLVDDLQASEKWREKLAAELQRARGLLRLLEVVWEDDLHGHTCRRRLYDADIAEKHGLSCSCGLDGARAAIRAYLAERDKEAK